jgi:DNA-binding CsgD family transcriptional regulator
MVRIYAISGGNPFYAVELARAIDDDMPGIDVQLPNSLSELVRARVGTLNAEVCEVLLAAACLANPSVELVARAIDTAPELIAEWIGDAEGKGIVRLDGNQIAFTHPLLAKGVYTNAPAAQRRRMHRRLAEIVAQPELHARHLALGATSADPLTLQALDTAAVTARRRGAPAAAAELVDLAIRLGGDTPDRRIRLARHHFEAGDPTRARTLLEETVAQLPRGTLRAEATCLLALVWLVHDSYMEAAGLLEEALEEAAPDLALRAEMVILLAFALVNAGQLPAAMAAAERAVAEATPLEQPLLLNCARSMRAMLRFMHGDGLDRHSLQRAPELDDSQPSVAVAVRPAVQNALLLAWVGQLNQARDQMLAIRRRCIEHGEESDLLFVAFHSVLIETWRGNFADAALHAEDAMERATQLGGDLALSVALMTRCTIGAYTGNSDEVRRDARDALAACQRSGSLRMAEWPTAAIGFLEVSLRNYDAAVITLQPLLTRLAAAPKATEIIAAPFVSDAAEALIQVGRLAEAETLVETVQCNGRRLDRAWMLAVGARCRSMLLAAQGDLEAATQAAEHAMTEHARLPMPFERARTQLLLGQLQRRRRHKDAASVTLREALAVFDELPAPRWAARARAALARTNVRPSRTTELTPSEQRVAELAASGMTNHAIAAMLFISPKTVEVNLSRIYRKFGIHSRAELGRRMVQPKG